MTVYMCSTATSRNLILDTCTHVAYDACTFCHIIMITLRCVHNVIIIFIIQMKFDASHRSSSSLPVVSHVVKLGIGPRL